MRLLALFALFVTPLAEFGPRPFARLPERPDEICALAREIARQPPCLAGGDCEAERLWRQAFGPPGVELLPPHGAAPATAAALRSTPGQPWPSPRPRFRALGQCPAATDDRGAGP